MCKVRCQGEIKNFSECNNSGLFPVKGEILYRITVESRFLEPSVFRTSRKLEPKVVSLSPFETVLHVTKRKNFNLSLLLKSFAEESK